MAMSIVPLFAVALGVQTEDLPSFDCSPVSTAFERAICANPVWAQWNRRMAEQYGALSNDLSDPAREALQLDQRWFRYTQRARFQNPYRTPRPGDESQGLKARTAFLGSIVPVPRSLVGHWANVWGGVEIKESRPGYLRLYVYASEPVNGRWVCDDIRIEGASQGQTLEGLPDIVPGYLIRASLRDGYLEIEEEALTPGGDGPFYCGRGGSVAGSYFRIE